MRCKTIAKTLDRFRTGELKPRQMKTVEEHLAACPACSEQLVEIERLAARISGLRANSPESVCEKVLEKAGDRYGVVDTDLGRVWIAFNERGITMTALRARDSSTFEGDYLSRRGRRTLPDRVPERFARAVQDAAAGNKPLAALLDLNGLAPFEREALLLLKRIPRGEVRSYQWLARAAGRPKAVRAVGSAMARNPLPLLLPCHRVVPAQGGIGNYAFGSELKRELLRREGVPVDELDDLAKRRVRYLGCISTKVYCFPTCRHARRMRPQNRMLFRDARQAAETGYRPCLRCKPELPAA